jgi:23S rRNA (cytosine1962-C5)-methyltransferase
MTDEVSTDTDDLAVAPTMTRTEERQPTPPSDGYPTLRLDEAAAGRVRGGTPFLEADVAGKPLDASIAGQAFRLIDVADNSVGYAIADPENKCYRVLPLLPDEQDRPLDFGFFRKRIRRAQAWRKRLDLVSDESAYRLINAEGDDLSGFIVDVYARHAVIYTFSTAFDGWAELLAKALLAEKVCDTVVGKVRPSGETPVGRLEYRTLSEEQPPRAVLIAEDDAKYEVHLLGGLNTGLFCDMRDVRRAIRPLSPNQRVLNLFAYTGSFSVVAALTGAKSVTTVEFAGGVVEWAKTNFTHNEIPTDGRQYKFVKADVFEFLKQARRKDEAWDLIILDPPISTNAPGRKWFLKSEYDRLIAHALRVLAPGGIIVVAANTVQSRPEGLEKHIRDAAKATGRRLRFLDSFGLPADFPTQMIQPLSRYLKVFFLWAE